MIYPPFIPEYTIGHFIFMQPYKCCICQGYKDYAMIDKAIFPQSITFIGKYCIKNDVLPILPLGARLLSMPRQVQQPTIMFPFLSISPGNLNRKYSL